MIVARPMVARFEAVGWSVLADDAAIVTNGDVSGR